MQAVPGKGPRRIIMAVDMDYFYAQCEEVRNPALKAKPVVVCMFSGRTEDSGAVATSNYVARGYGVKSGIPIFRAKEILKGVDAAFLPADFPYYESASARIMGILKGHADRLAQESVDEAYLDISKRADGDYIKAEELAKAVKSEILRREGFTCSVGIGPNKLTAKMASDKCKPNGLLVVKEGEFLSNFGSLPVDRLYGVGKKTATKLEEMGARTIEELSRLPSHQLQAQFGKRLGLYFYLASKGEDDEPLTDWEREQVGRMMTLKEDTRDMKTIEEALKKMAEEISAELDSSKFSYKAVGIVVVDTLLKQRSRSRSLKAEERGADPIAKIGAELVEELLEDEPDMLIRRLSVRVASLRSSAGQMDLSSFY
jgi:DNA polymerase IV (DinB-like DNA polymerase)